MQFLALQGHTHLIPQGGLVQEFYCFECKRLDLFKHSKKKLSQLTLQSSNFKTYVVQASQTPFQTNFSYRECHVSYLTNHRFSCKQL